VVEVLLANGAEVDAESNKGHTALHRAVARGCKQIAELLLAKGAKVNAKDKWGRTPLEVAVSEDHKDIVELLRRHSGVNGK
jgi:ankyrin repeat protein